MSKRYADWIAANVTDPTGKCREVTEAMAKAFPELTRVRGHYRFSQHEKPWPHWWLTTADGAIVDPTVGQWPDLGAGDYVPHDESRPEPIGKCLDCGGDVYPGDPSPFCSAECERATAAAMKAGRW